MQFRLKPLLWSIVAILLTQPVSAKLYKWVDADGKTHYTDKLPPEQATQPRSELNEQGIEVNKLGRAKTADELAQEQELERLRKEREKIIAKQKAEDRVLLRTFRSEDDIIMAQDGKLNAIDVMIEITKSNIKQSKEQLTDMQSRAASLERMGKKPRAKLVNDISSTKQHLKDNYASIIKRENDKERIKKIADRDLERFRTLKKLEASRAPEIKRKKRTSQLDHVAPCPDAETCDSLWEIGKEYSLKHATTKTEMISESVVMTAPPEKDNDISITLSRIPNTDSPGGHLFFDLQCKDSKKGKIFCAEERITKIKNGFKDYVFGNKPPPTANKRPIQ